MPPVLDFNNVCRLCMVLIEGPHNEMFMPLFRENQPMELAKKLADIAGVEVIAGDGLPGQVCRSCVLHVNSCHAFRQKCRSSDRDFRQYLAGVHANVFKRELNLFGADTKEAFNHETLDIVNNSSSVSELTFNTTRNNTGNSKDRVPLPQRVCQPMHLQQPFDTSLTWIHNTEPPTMRDLVNNVSMWVAGGEVYPWHRASFQFEQPSASVDDRLAPTPRTNMSPSSQHPVNKQKNTKIGRGVQSASCVVDGILEAASNGKGQNKRIPLPVSHIKKENEACKLEDLCGMEDNSYNEVIPQKCQSNCDADGLLDVKSGGIVMYESATNNMTILNSEAKITSMKRSEVGCKVEEIASVGSVNQSENLTVNDAIKPESLFKANVETSVRLGSFIDDFQKFGNVKRKKLMFKNYECDICNKLLSSEGSLKVHKLNHTGIRPFCCNIEGCTKSFSQYGNLQTHIRSHLGIKPYRCKFCGTSFVQLANLQAHERKHTGAQPYTCRICDATFAHASSLRSHVIARHADQATGPVYTCSQCEREFKSQNVLKKHVTNVHGNKKQ